MNKLRGFNYSRLMFQLQSLAITQSSFILACRRSYLRVPIPCYYHTDKEYFEVPYRYASRCIMHWTCNLPLHYQSSSAGSTRTRISSNKPSKNTSTSFPIPTGSSLSQWSISLHTCANLYTSFRSFSCAACALCCAGV